MTMPDYSLEQKAKAFDMLWKTCGKALPIDFCWKEHHFDTSNEITGVAERRITRVPHYQFAIWCVGDCHEFADVLHRLATKE